MKAQFFEQLFKSAIPAWKAFIELDNNEKIIFSGKFGTGKSTFLDHFFDQENQKKIFSKQKYNVIHIYPVSYSVANNEDIFEYIKYDILYELLNLSSAIDNTQPSINIATLAHIKTQFPKILLHLLRYIPHLGKDFEDMTEDIKNLFREYCETLPKSDMEKVHKFGLQFQDKIGSLYEENEITFAIRSSLRNLSNKVNSTNKSDILEGETYENILILDDLDRIDPNHIFRIFNIFSSHLSKNSNKFSFDKIIFVCDIINIKNIFLNRYGADVDFNGYIDKFYSRGIYYFNLKPDLKDFISILVKEIQVNHSHLNANVYRGHNRLYLDCIMILQLIILNDGLNLRTIMKFYKANLDLNDVRYRLSLDVIINKHSIYTPFLLEYVLTFFYSKENIIEVLAQCINKKFIHLVQKGDWERYCDIIGTLIMLIDYKNHKFIPGPYTFNDSTHSSFSIKYQINAQKDGSLLEPKQEEIESINFYALLSANYSLISHEIPY